MQANLCSNKSREDKTIRDTPAGIRKVIDLPEARARITVADYTAYSLPFTASFCEYGRAIPIVECGKTAAEALEKLSKNKRVKEACRKAV